MFHLSRREFLGSIFSSFALTTTTASIPQESFGQQRRKILNGVNLAGAEFYNKPGGRPGKHYFYPDETDIEFFVGRGFGLFRLPFKWERVQRDMSLPLGEGKDTEDLRLLIRSVQKVRNRGAICVLDLHNYGRRQIQPGLIATVGSKDLPTRDFIEFWTRLASFFPDDAGVWLGLMNEPNGIAAPVWAEICQLTVLSLRKAGTSHRILVPGTAWTGAHSWVSSGNAAAFADFFDPDENFVFEVHQYLDKDSSGTQGTCVAGSGHSRLKMFQDWCLEKPGRRGFLGEFGSGDPKVPGHESCAKELSDLLNEMEANPDIWVGWAAWGGGRRWADRYPFRLQNAKEPDVENGYLKMLMR